MIIAMLIMLIVANLLIGSVDIDALAVWQIVTGRGHENHVWEIIILNTRLPMIATAALSGAALSVSGLLLQTAFNNPLAGPSILGVSTGASFGVAVVMLASGSALWLTQSVGTYMTILIGALAGAALVLIVLLLFSTMVHSSTMLLIIGILVSYLTSSAVSLLNFFATEEGVHSYVIWGLGNFSGVTPSQLPFFAFFIIATLALSTTLVKPLNALLLGTRYAENLGVNTKQTRNSLLIITGILTAGVTAFCGPISFIGLVVPHIARLVLNTSNHNRLLPATMLAGATVALLCTLISVLPQQVGVIPINAITPIIGVPIIIYIIINRKNIQYFN
ncbi:MAG: iron ABC transporter permease [Muribaculaceae bacterium]|nr:iron ABC transporter permease [Muribaculaceae bacterium]